MKYYLITIRHHRVNQYITQYEIDNILSYLEINICSLSIKAEDVSYETSGKYGQLHAHAICKVSNCFSYRGWTDHNGFRIHWKRLHRPYYKSVESARKYLKKDQVNQTQSDILYENTCKNVNLFTLGPYLD